MDTLLSIDNLTVDFQISGQRRRVLRGVTFEVERGSVTAIVGESGCGKSLTARSVMGLLPRRAVYGEGSSICFDGAELLAFDGREWSSFRGKRCSMVFQDALAALDPTMRVGDQIAEKIMVHDRVSKHEALDRAVSMLGRVGIPDPVRRARQYPHEFSGGMRQRVMIALALTLDPELVIADEPTTALDVTVQADIIDVLRDMRDVTGMTVVLITHDLGLVADFADRIVVMYAGQVVESASSDEIFLHPCHPYTKALIAAVPRVDQASCKLSPIDGMPPDLTREIEGCAFAPRCTVGSDICHGCSAGVVEVSPGHIVRCHQFKKGVA